MVSQWITFIFTNIIEKKKSILLFKLLVNSINYVIQHNTLSVVRHTED